MSNISEPFDIRKVANEVLGTALPPRRMTYDRRCYTVAETFLEDHPELNGRQSELAAHIQQAIEDWVATANAERRCHHSLTALADEPAELEAAVTDRLIDDVNDRFDGRDHNDQEGWR